MIVLASLLIWASTSLGVFAADGKNESCFKDLSLHLTPQISNEGWNDLGRGFLGIFTPAKLTDEHWESIGKIRKGQDTQDNIKKIAMSMGGVVFLVVVSVILILCFCAAPCSLCVYSCTCKKKCKPKSNTIIAYTGIACNSVAILTIGLSILFCYLSIDAFATGVGNVPDSTRPLPKVILGAAKTFKEQIINCVGGDLVSGLTAKIDAIPGQIAAGIAKNAALESVMKIDFEEKKANLSEFAKRSGVLATNLTTIKTTHGQTDPIIVTAIGTALDATIQAMTEVQTQLNSGTMEQKLNNVNEMRKKAEEDEIKITIKDKIGDLSEKIKKITDDVNKQIEDKFKNIDSVKEKINNATKPMYDKIDEHKDQLGYAKVLNLIMFPCYLALASAIWSTCIAIKFVQKKKAKPKEKLGLLIPLSIGLCLAFLPLLVSTTFMSFAGVTNVACGTIFKDDKGILPRLLTTFEVETKIKNKDVDLDLLTVIEECSAGKPLIAAVNGSNMIAEDLLIKEFKVDDKRRELTDKLNSMEFGLPIPADWDTIDAEISSIKGKRDSAKTQIDKLNTIQPPLPQPMTVLVPALVPIHTDLNTFIEDVRKFEEKCKTEITGAKLLTNEVLKAEVKLQMLGDGTPQTDALLKMQYGLNQHYLAFRADLLEKSTSCAFLFDLFTDVGSIICDQALGGLNGVYAAIGLGVMSFFTATVGTVLIWHTLRAGKGQKKDDDKGGSDDSKEGKKKKGKKAKKSEGEEEETSPPPPANMAGKVGEQATPIGSDPSPQGGLVITVTAPNNPVIVAVPTDPAADKTNPSLLPQDVLPDAGAPGDAGTPISPIQMVPIQDNQEDNPKSQTGPQ